MRKYIPFIGIVATLVAATLSVLLWGNVIIGFAFALSGVMIWAFTRSGAGEVPSGGSKKSPKELKKYRMEHPGSSISDAIRATR